MAVSAGLLTVLTASLLAHVTPVVQLRTQADIIRSTLPKAVQFHATDVRPGKSELQQIVDRTQLTPNVRTIRFYEELDASDHLVGTVVFPQVDTQHGPI